MANIIKKISQGSKKYLSLTRASMIGFLITFTVLGWEISEGLVAQQDSVLNRVEYFFYDMRYKFTLAENPRSPENNIAIIDIDEKSLLAEGQWPWSRAKIGQLVEKLAEQGVLVVAFDIVFAEPERNPATELLENYPVSNIKQALKNIEKISNADQQFADTLSATDVILGYFFSDDNSQVGASPPPIIELNEEILDGFVIHQQTGILSNLNMLQDNARGAGFLHTVPDADGAIRRSPVIHAYQGNLYPSLALASGMAYLFAEDIDLQTSDLDGLVSISSLSISDFRTNTDAQGKVLVPFIGGQHSFPYISATDVLNDNVEEGALEAAVVFVGTSSLGLADLKPTPVGQGYPGVEVHANILLGLLEGGIPFKPDWENGLIRVLIIIIGFTLAGLLPHMGAVGLIATGSGTLLVYVAANYYFWSRSHFDLSLAPIIMLIVSITVINIALGFFKESSRRKDLKDMFGQYVPPAHIDKMVSSDAHDAFASDSRELTVLFSDIRSFTSISEGLSALELKQMLNEYFTPITKIIFETDGTIDKYVGDMVMAFWGAPLEDKDHRLHALEASLLMLEKTEELKAEFKAKGLPEINIGVGLNTGVMNVGDMGSQYRKAYTVLGDAVNLGSRLESLTKFYGAKCLVGEGTTIGVDSYAFRHMDKIQVKGKEESINVFEPLGKLSELDEEQKLALENYHQALKLYWRQSWEEAKSLFSKLKEDSPNTKIFQIYLDRIETMSKSDIDEAWDGTFRHTSK